MASTANAGRALNGDASRIAMRRRAALAEGSPDYLAKRADLIKCAAAVFSEKGYNSATLNDVAACFGTDRASLYYYVGSKRSSSRNASRVFWTTTSKVPDVVGTLIEDQTWCETGMPLGDKRPFPLVNAG